MNLNPAELLNPIFDVLDALISNYGVYLYLVFVRLALLAIVWILSGGLRRKRPQGNSITVVPAIIFAMQTPSQPPPPIIGIEADQTWNGDDETTDQP
ncbi:MAG: hypothetical protein PHY43_03440 [Verrucomicrobiales bacterium]|nr:hypothetical protein [Verrucomicrobiales bacterium]